MKTYVIETTETRIYHTIYEIEAESEEEVLKMDKYEFEDGFVSEKLIDEDCEFRDLYEKENINEEN